MQLVHAADVAVLIDERAIAGWAEERRRGNRRSGRGEAQQRFRACTPPDRVGARQQACRSLELRRGFRPHRRGSCAQRKGSIQQPFQLPTHVLERGLFRENRIRSGMARPRHLAGVARLADGDDRRMAHRRVVAQDFAEREAVDQRQVEFGDDHRRLQQRLDEGFAAVERFDDFGAPGE